MANKWGTNFSARTVRWNGSEMSTKCRNLVRKLRNKKMFKEVCRTERFSNRDIISKTWRRTTELTTLLLQEEINIINNTENSCTTNIRNHKTRKHDKNAFNDQEFHILQTFIKDNRPKLTSDTKSRQSRFPY